MGNVVQNVTATTASDELQTRNNKEHQRVYDPQLNNTMKQVLKELKIMNTHLQIMTGEEL